MPWEIQSRGGKHCVVKATTGKVMHCYDNEADAKDYLAALNIHAHKEIAKYLEQMRDQDTDAVVSVEKQEDGRYWVTAVSTAALKDKDGETFDTIAMDYDIQLARETGEYPEFRVFHNKSLGIGKVEKMRRVGIFAVDEGPSYTDPFSLDVCEKMLSNNKDGKWRVSRGFYLLETSGNCPSCGEGLVIRTKHMVAGFRCPNCSSVHMNYRGVLKDVHFRKTKTFDVTVTDIPCVPYTGVGAVRLGNNMEDLVMNKKQLKEKLIAAGIAEDAIDARLSGLTDEQLKEFSDLPEAEVLKEFVEEVDDDDDQVFVLDPDVLKEFTDIVEKTVEAKVKSVLDGLTVEIPEMKDLEINFKETEFPQLKELADTVADLATKVDTLLKKDQERLKEMLEETPRSAKLRIRRFKATPPEDEEDEEGEDEEMEEEEMPKKKHLLKQQQDGVIYDSEGNVVPSMTQFVLSPGE